MKLDWIAIKAAVRTAGALMVGNVAVAATVLGNRHYVDLAALFLIGVGAIIATSVIDKE